MRLNWGVIGIRRYFINKLFCAIINVILRILVLISVA